MYIVSSILVRSPRPAPVGVRGEGDVVPARSVGPWLLLLALFTLLSPRDGVGAGLARSGVGEEPPPQSVRDSVARIGRGDPELDRRLDELLGAGDYLLITRDTLIGAAETVPRSLLVLGATLIVEGSVAGDLVEVAANVFVRPGAHIEGDLVNIAGGLYPSALARVDGRTIDRPLAPYRVHRQGEVWIIEGRRRVDRVVLDGFLGFHPPTYERVDALGIRWGASYLFSEDTVAPTRLHGWVGYMSGRGALEGGADLSRQVGRTTLVVGAAEETATNDRWIRGDLRNSLSFLLDGDDYRNYYLVRRAYLQATTRVGGGDRRVDFTLRGQLEADRSLRTISTWTIIGGDRSRPNPPIDEGEITGVALFADGLWVGHTLAWEVFGSFETAGQVLGGDFSFNRAVLFGEFGMDAFADHVLLFRWYFQGPVLGTSRLPRQRWSMLGGSGTLSAYSIGEFHGDRVVFAESRYVIPLPRGWTLPLLGRPDLELAYAVGNAWTEGMDSDLIQNMEARIQFSFLHFYIATDPTDAADRFKVSVGLSWPFGDGYLWRY